MSGPLYHLTERVDRLTALHEAHRVLRSGGLLLAVGISCSPLRSMGYARDGLTIPPSPRHPVRSATWWMGTSQPTNHPEYFTTAFFHHPQELQSEVEGDVVSCMKGRCLSKGHYGFHTTWSPTSGREAARTMAGARTMSARRGTVSAWCQRASVGGCTQSVAPIPIHKRRFTSYPVPSLFHFSPLVASPLRIPYLEAFRSLVPQVFAAQVPGFDWMVAAEMCSRRSA